MMKYLSIVFLFISVQTYSQNYLELFFDGADTTDYSMVIELDTAAENIWQIGQPQKSVFNAAFTLPNALVTDTVLTYPVLNTSIFQYGVQAFYNFGITAIQWTQKLDIDSGDIALIEYSIDTGHTWVSVFDNPYTYNFYGYESINVDTLQNGDIGFSGTDTNWRDIWLCFDFSWMSMQDSIILRHVFKSDSIASQNDGWMIDNMLQHQTFFHTIGETPQETYLEVFPNPTSNRVNISVKKTNTFHIIEELTVLDAAGRVLEKHVEVPTKFFVDLADYPAGIYYIKVKTNLQTETKKIIVTR
ncbi:T9SS type A sorting domain-containing protein [Putridiphycobacter roseus]|nr:T9SS type A sorting domain-containing protein [Putridiphycobacter roseus]